MNFATTLNKPIRRPLGTLNHAERAPPNYLLRAAFVAAKARAMSKYPAEVFQRMFPNDDISPQLLQTRADATAATTTTSGWASQLTQSATGQFLASLAPASAAATLFKRGVQVVTAEFNSITFPMRSTAPLTPTFVTETNPIQVRQDALTGVTLGPARKLGSIAVMSKSLLKRSDADSIFTTLLLEDASKGFDAAVFSSEDGSGDPIAGLLNGATSLSGGAGLLADLRTLAASVSTNGSGEVVFIGGPAFAAAASLDATIKATILGSQVVSESTLIAVDPQSVIWGAGLDPEIDVSAEAVLHMSDDPDEIVSAAGSVSDPVRSLYQTDAIATRLILPIAFVKRRDAGIAYMTNLSTVW